MSAANMSLCSSSRRRDALPMLRNRIPAHRHRSIDADRLSPLRCRRSPKSVVRFTCTIRWWWSLRPDHRQHRDMLSSTLRHTRCFVVAPALVDMLHKKNGQSEVANRYFEGAAAGAVLVGSRPTVYADSLFRLAGFSHRLQGDGSDAGKVICGLLADPARCATMSTHAVEARPPRLGSPLEEDLRTLGIKPTEAMETGFATPGLAASDQPL